MPGELDFGNINIPSYMNNGEKTHVFYNEMAPIVCTAQAKEEKGTICLIPGEIVIPWAGPVYIASHLPFTFPNGKEVKTLAEYQQYYAEYVEGL